MSRYYYERRSLVEFDPDENLMCQQCEDHICPLEARHCGQCEDTLCGACVESNAKCHMCDQKEQGCYTDQPTPALPDDPTCCHGCMKRCEYCKISFHSLCWVAHIERRECVAGKRDWKLADKKIQQKEDALQHLQSEIERFQTTMRPVKKELEMEQKLQYPEMYPESCSEEDCLERQGMREVSHANETSAQTIALVESSNELEEDTMSNMDAHELFSFDPKEHNSEQKSLMHAENQCVCKNKELTQYNENSPSSTSTASLVAHLENLVKEETIAILEEEENDEFERQFNGGQEILRYALDMAAKLGFDQNNHLYSLRRWGS